MTPNEVKYLVVHCSATQAGQDIGRAEIDRWHREKGWLMIGYHFVIRRDGTIETGRALTQVGAHVEGFNHESIGICMVGGINAKGKAEDNFTEDQYQSLAQKLLELRAAGYGHAIVQGHRDFPDVHKDCPSFSVADWLKKSGL